MNEANLSFEASVARLEEIVRLLQKGSVPLADALKLFQEGAALITGAAKLLDEAELQVRQFTEASAAEDEEEDNDDDAIPF